MKKDIYVYQSGTLKQESNSLVLLTKKGKTYIPVEQIDNIHIFGEITLNKRLLQLLSKNKIIVMYYSYFGNYLGSYIPKSAKNGKILVEQVSSFTDLERRNHIAYQFLNGQIDNELALLRYYGKEGYYVKDIIEYIVYQQLELRALPLNRADYATQAMLIEARCKERYYQLFDMVLKLEPFEFKFRSTYPPGNEVNAMLSYGYAILYGDMLCAISRSKLTPDISYVHSIAKHTNALQYDMADILKPVFIDRLVLRLIRKKQIKPSHFAPAKKGIYLTKEGKEIFVKEYDKLLRKTVYDSRSKRDYSYKQILSREVYLLTDHILGKKEYKPFRMRW